MKITKAIEISDAKINFVSLVNKAANKRQFLITKSEDGQANFTTVGKIIKADEATHYITGIVYEPLTEDSDGNFMTEDEIKKAAYWFAKNGDNVDIQHSFEAADGLSVVENYIAPCDMTIGETPIKKGAWIMTVEVENGEIWEKVQKGEITGFSMGGVGKYSETETELEKSGKESKESKEANVILKAFADLCGFDLIKKGKVKEIYDKRMKNDGFWNAFYALENVLSTYNWDSNVTYYETDDTVIKDALADFSGIITEVLAMPNIVKHLAESKVNIIKNESEANEMTKQEIQTLIDEAVQKAVTKMAKAPATPAEPEIPKEPELTADAVQLMVSEAVAKAVEPILKARGIPSNIDDLNDVVKSDSEEHYLSGIL